VSGDGNVIALICKADLLNAPIFPGFPLLPKTIHCLSYSKNTKTVLRKAGLKNLLLKKIK
jgi:hypothetical protein